MLVSGTLDKQRLSAPLIIAVFILLAGWLSGCEVTTYVRGNMPTPYQIGLVEIGKTDKTQVSEELGTPTVKSSVDENLWFYTSQTLSDHPIKGRQLLGQKVLMIRFARFERVAAIEQFDIDVNGIIRPLNKETNLSLRDKSLIEQTLGMFFPDR